LLLSALAVLLVALFHEDAAVVTAAYFSLEGKVAIPSALALIYTGVLANNFALYSLGAAARLRPNVRRWLIVPLVENAGEQLKKRALAAVVLCRFTPGLLTPVYVGCGWFGIPLRRIALAALLAPAAYLSVAFALMMVFGELLLQQLREWSWILPFAAIAVTVAVAGMRRHRRPRRRTFAK